MRQPAFRALLCGAFAIVGCFIAAPVATAASGLFCRPEGGLSPSDPQVGAVLAQSGGRCFQPEQAEIWVEARAFRDGVDVGTEAKHCPPGRFTNGMYCSPPTMLLTNPPGQQSFKLVVSIRYIPGPGAREVPSSTTATGSY